MIERYTLPEIEALWTEEAKYSRLAQGGACGQPGEGADWGDPDRRGGGTGREGGLHRRTYPRDQNERPITT